MKKILKILCLLLLCLVLVFITKLRLDQALVIVPGQSQTESSQEAEPLKSEVEPDSQPEPTATPEPTPEPEPEYFTLSFIGDMTLTTNQFFSEQSSAHYAYKMQGDYSYPFANTAQYFSDDEFTLGNLECSFSDNKLQASMYAQFYFLCPTEWLQIVTLGGVDFVTTANNHFMDFNERGADDTKAALEAAGIPYGTEGQSQIVTTPSGIKLGIYTAGLDMAPKKEPAVAAVKALKEQGADYIICMFHWGHELHYTPEEYDVDMAHACIDAGADLIYGSHSHCLQPMEEYNDGIILYSMGNWSFGGSTRPSDPDTAIFRMTIRRDVDGSIHNDSFEIIPCCVSSDLESAAKMADNYNDYKPTPYEPGTEAYDRAMSKILGTYDGKNITRDYSDIYASYS